jgi:hypothetical protein
MKAIRLSQATILEGVPRAKGEHVLVPDDFNEADLIDRVVSYGVEKINAAKVVRAEKHEEVRVVVKEIAAIDVAVASLEVAMKEAELEKDEKIREEKLKQIQVEMDAAADRKKELEAKLTPVVVEVKPTVEDPKEEPVEGEVKPVEGGK